MNDSGDLSSGVSDYSANSAVGGAQFAPLQPGDGNCFTANASSINSQVDLQKLGFNDQLQINDTAADVVSLNDHGREMSLNDDGSYQYVARSGDSYWRVASDVLSARNGGEKASDKEVLDYVGTLARYNDKADPNKLAIGEAIYIPPAVNDGSTDRDESSDAGVAPAAADGPTATALYDKDAVISTADNTTTLPEASLAAADKAISNGQSAKADVASAPAGTMRASEYNSGISMSVMDPGGNSVELNNIKAVVTDRQEDGHYSTTMTNEDGAIYTSEAGPTGFTLSISSPQ